MRAPPPPPRATLRRPDRPQLAWTAPLALALATFGACAAPPRAAARPATTPAKSAAQPTLEEVFLIPGLHGEPPRLRSLSGDGQWALVEWRGVETTPEGKRNWAKDRSPLLVPTGAGLQELEQADSLAQLLERLEREAHAAGDGTRIVAKLEDWKPARAGTSTWSERGSVLAVAWEGAVVLLELGGAEGLRRRVLYVDPPRPEGASEDTPRDDGQRLGRVIGLTFEEQGSRLVVRAGQELYVFPLDTPKPWPLALAEAECPTRLLAAPLERIEFSRDRKRAFARGAKLATPELAGVPNDAQFVDLATGTGRALEGLSALKSPENLDLSPAGEFLFAFDVDRSAQPPPTMIPDYLTERVSTRESRRELADDTWPARKPFVWSTSDGVRRVLELPGDSKASANGIGWAPRGEPRVAFRRTSTDYREVETWIWDRNGQRLALVERDEHWVGGPGSFVRWTKDGEHLLLASECAPLSTTPGRNQVFELDPSNGALRQLTEVEGEVSRLIVTEEDTVIVCASRNDPAQRELGVVEANGVRWLPIPPGMNTSPTVSADGRVLLFLHEELGVPGELYRVALDGSAPAARLTSTIPAEYLARDWIRPEKLSVASADGTTVRAHVYSPRGTSLAKPPKARPCVVFIHGAGYLQNVTDSMTEYAVNLMFHSRLAELGYVVADVDYRGSAGYGAKFRGDVQFQLGKLELEDIGAVVDELARRGAIDPTRVACYGGSYGGFLTLMALFKEPERWAGGAALRSVTDWRTYHPGYTQPRLGRPSTHPDAYAASSPIDHAQNLKDPLLLLHGMVDSNVFAQDTIRLMEKLIDLGLDFDAMLYPSQNHAFEDGLHWLDEYKRIERFLARCLAP